METLTIKKEHKIAVLAWFVYVITMIAVILAKVVFHDLYIGCCIIIGIGMLLYIAVLQMIKGDYEELKNRAILIYSGITKFIFLFGVTFENKLFVPEALYSHDSFLTYLAYIMAPIFVVVELFLYIKDKKSAKLRTYVMVTFLIIYYMGLMNISSHWVIMIIVPILTAFTGFQNVKTVVLGGSIVSVLALLGAMRHIHFWETGVVGDMVWGIPRALKYFLTVRSTEETGYLRWSYIIFVLFFSFFTVVTMLVTRHIKNYNDDKLEVIKKEQENTQKLVEKILDIGMEVKKSAFDTNNIVNELDKTIEKSGAVLEEVEKSNSKKQKGITQQDEMNENIAILIKDLVREVDKASNATKDTLTGLENSRISFEDLKNKSDKIYGNNKEVIEVIEQFVKTAKEVRNITSGIAGISDETNLLALNASIKSARAGEVGKGFAVVAKQVRQLAVETSELTEEIDSMVEKLQASAFISQDAMDEVVGAINEENQTIDQTIKDFENMQTNIHGLSENVIGIDSSVNELARFNEEIENHINELADLSKKVSLDIKSAENSNNDNKERILLTRQLMDEMLVVAERMDEFYYQNGGQYE